MTNIIEQLESEQIKKNTPSFRVGDQVRVGQTIVEGKKSRVQFFEGTVVRQTGIRSRAKFTVRKVIDSVGVEKTYLLNSPLVDSVKVTRKGKVRRARLYYLRERVGAKANRIKARG